MRVSAIALALSALLLPACTNDPNAGGPAAESNVTAEKVADQTNELIGETVTVRSDVVEKIGPSTFTVTDEEFFGRDTILVVNASGTPFIFPPAEAEVQVTGTVAKFVVADINREYGLGLQPDVYAEYEGKPAIIAQSLAVAVEPGEIAEDPNLYYGRTVAVPGEVAQVVNPNAFRFNGGELLVLGVNQPAAIEDGKEVVATGVLRQFVAAEVERDFDLDLSPELEVEYENKPVLIAQSITPSEPQGEQPAGQPTESPAGQPTGQ
jgi:hypothetical protein